MFLNALFSACAVPHGHSKYAALSRLISLPLALIAAGCFGGDKDSDIEFLYQNSDIAVEIPSTDLPSTGDNEEDGDGGMISDHGTEDHDSGADGDTDATTHTNTDINTDGGNQQEDVMDGGEYDADAEADVGNFEGDADADDADADDLPPPCPPDQFYNEELGKCVDKDDTSLCPEGLHDGGNGQCVSIDECAPNFHDGGDGTCVYEGTCVSGYHNNGLGLCIQTGCADGYQFIAGLCTKIDTMPKFILIPAGSFTPSHSIPGTLNSPQVLQPFQIGRTPVTVEEFQACINAGQCLSNTYIIYNSKTDPFCNLHRGPAWNDHPVNCVTPEGARNYCQWIGGFLPSEAQWEYAASHNGTNNTQTTYPWGNTPPSHCLQAVYFDPQTGDYCGGRTTGSESKIPLGTASVQSSGSGNSPLGLSDLSGNVWEIVSTPFTSTHTIPQPAAKGGAWRFGPEALTIEARISYDDGTHYPIDSFGFRCAKKPNSQ